MIKAVIVVNNHGKPRFIKFYDEIPEEKRIKLVKEVFQKITQRGDVLCNFLDGTHVSTEIADWSSDIKFVYRHFATLYFIFVIDSSESELGTLDLIQVFVEALDQAFENICELDIIFHPDRVLYILDQMIMGGLVFETDIKQIVFISEECDRLADEAKIKGQGRDKDPSFRK
ncbi:ap-3 complex subunit sigma-2 [Anaeramoeba ignava]|uniref:AP complex subunit sigma n=1 Tax=Anaeramoeba ignava TaxID=1746090 RepID=A0A9Q0LKS5_ANAIG|nr:ap-3 complex subunit sigma-2 [Anaeramoeba ignava]